MSRDFAVTGKVGTLGAGIDVTTGLTDTVNLRLNGNYIGYSYSDTLEDESYELDLSMMTVGLLADWHCFDNAFRVTGGVYYNGNKLEGDASATSGTYTINDVDYSAADIGVLSSEIEFGNSVAPYFGIGYGNAIDKEGRWHFSFDVGILVTGSPEASASVSGPIGADPIFQQDLADEVNNIEDEMSDFAVYPVVSIGLSYKF
jgi:hypothetical protein